MQDSHRDCCKNEEAASPAEERFCPGCGAKGKSVAAITLRALVVQSAQERLADLDGFRLCASPGCEIVYFHPVSGAQVARSEMTVKVGQKETASSRTACYCFGYSAYDIEKDVRASGSSTIAVTIGDKCKRGLDRCQETNPQGSCCLGNVRGIAKAALHAIGASDQGDSK